LDLGILFADRGFTRPPRLDLDLGNRRGLETTKSSNDIPSALAAAARVCTSPVFDPFSISEMKP
jgi:hypothetical protein